MRPLCVGSLLLVALIPVAHAKECQFPDHVQAGGAWAGAEILAPKLFADYSLADMVTQAHKCQDEEPGRQIVKLSFFTSKDDRGWTLTPNRSPHVPFLTWLAGQHDRVPEPMAQVLIVGQMVVGRKLNANGKLEKFGDIGEGTELLDIIILAPRPNTADGVNGAVTLFVRTKRALQVSDGAALANRLMSSAKSVKNATVVIRTDAWFVNDLVFPLPYRFDAEFRGNRLANSPLHPDQLKTPTLICEQPSATFVCTSEDFSGEPPQ